MLTVTVLDTVEALTLSVNVKIDGVNAVYAVYAVNVTAPGIFSPRAGGTSLSNVPVDVLASIIDGVNVVNGIFNGVNGAFNVVDAVNGLFKRRRRS